MRTCLKTSSSSERSLVELKCSLAIYSLASVILTFAVLNHFRLPHFVNLFSFFFQMTSLWRARILPSVLACSSSGQSTWKEAASKTAHKWLPKLLTPALSICSHFLQQPEQNTGIDYYSHAMEKVYLLHIFYKRTKELCRTIQISNIVLIYL